MCPSNMLQEIAQLAIMLICVSNTATIQQTQQHVAGNKCCSNMLALALSNQLLDGCLQKYWQPVASNQVASKLPGVWGVLMGQSYGSFPQIL